MKISKHYFFNFVTIFILLTTLFSKTSCVRSKEDPHPSSLTNHQNVTQLRLSNFSWTQQSVVGNWLTSTFSDVNNGFITGTGGSIAKTIDGGTSFLPITSPTNSDLYGACFLTDQIGFIAGNETSFFGTIDGGQTWSPQLLPALPNGTNFRNISNQNGVMFLTGGKGVVLKSNDNGVSWIMSNNGIFRGCGIYSTFAKPTGICFAGADNGMIFKTDLMGKWTGKRVTDSRAIVTSIKFVNDSLGYATTTIFNPLSSDKTTYLQTYDGGNNWIEKTIIGEVNALAEVEFVDGNIGYMAGGSLLTNLGVVYSTANGGYTWHEEKLPKEAGRLTTLSLRNVTPSNVTLNVSGLNNTVLQGQ